MRFLSRAGAALIIGASGLAAFVSPVLAQTCVCPPAEGAAAVSGPVIQAGEAPPPLPEYEQPPMPAPGHVWTPGYWAWNNTDYYWVPGAWVEPPRVGVLWTPPYWGFVGGVYMFHRGYWGAQVGFYGGINYGFGYAGFGYQGGRWQNGQLFYNTAVNNLGNVHVGNTYNAPVTINRTVNVSNNVSYNGGPGGLQVKPTPEQEQVAAQPHIPPTPVQTNQVRTASVNAEQFQSVNKGKPAVAATPRAGELRSPGIVPAKAAGAAEAPAAGQPAVPAGTEKPEQKHPAERPLGGGQAQPEGKPLGGQAQPERKPLVAAPAPEKPQEKLRQGAEKPQGLERAKGSETPKELGKPPGMEAPKGAEKPTGPEKVKGQERPQGLRETPRGQETPKGAEKPKGLERQQGLQAPNRPQGPGGPEKQKGPKVQEQPKRPGQPQGMLEPPAERPMTRAMDGGSPPRPATAQNGAMRGPAGAAERRPREPGGKAAACGRPGLPPCPR